MSCSTERDTPLDALLPAASSGLCPLPAADCFQIPAADRPLMLQPGLDAGERAVETLDGAGVRRRACKMSQSAARSPAFCFSVSSYR